MDSEAEEVRRMVADRIAATSVPKATAEQVQAVATLNAQEPEYAGGKAQVERLLAGHGHNHSPVMPPVIDGRP